MTEGQRTVEFSLRWDLCSRRVLVACSQNFQLRDLPNDSPLFPRFMDRSARLVLQVYPCSVR